MVRQIASKEYRNGAFGIDGAALEYDDGMREGRDGPWRLHRPFWVVRAWDVCAHDSLASAKAHFRRIGQAA